MYRFLIKIAAVFCLSSISLVFAETTAIKIATIMPDGSAWMKLLREASEQIAQRTEGRVNFKYYPAGVMGDDKAVLRKIRIGQLQGAALTAGAFEKIYPDSQLYTLPLAFETFNQVDRVRKQMDQTLVDGFEKIGFVTFGFAEGGFAYPMTKTEPIRQPDDLKNHKVWAPSDDSMSVETFSAINITPIPLALGDVLAGLQTGLVDTIASPPIPALVMQWHSQVKSLTQIPISYIYGLMAIDKKAFVKLAASDQKVVREIMTKTFAALDKLNRQDGLNALSALEQQGIAMIALNDAEKDKWKDLGKQAQKILTKKESISKELYAKFQTLLRE